MDANQVNDMLAARAEDVCRKILPTGKRDKDEWVCGDVTGAPGQSLRIHLAGSKAGWWADFAASDRFRGRNLLSLWMAVTGKQFTDVIREAKSFLGVPDSGEWRRATATGGDGRRASSGPGDERCDRARPLEQEYVPLRRDGAVWRWLVDARKINPDTLSLYRVGESRDGKCVVFPFFDASGKLVSAKFRDIENKERMFVLPRGARKILWGIHAVVADDAKAGVARDDAVICEGEIDAMTLHSACGIPAMSVPFGAKWPGSTGRDPNDEWIEHAYDWLERYSPVYLALDKDEPGAKASEAIARRLGRARCRGMAYGGRKDVNEWWTSGATSAEIDGALANAAHMDPPELRRPMEFRKEVWEQFYPVDGVEPGEEPPWALPFRFRPGELTIWQGYTKHGKTVCLSYCLLRFAERGRKCLVASLEIPAVRTLQNMIRQAIAKRKPDERGGEFDAALRFLDSHVFIYDKVGTAQVDSVLEIFAYAARKYGVSHFVVDSLMRLDIDEEENDQIKTLMNRLLDFAKDYGVHVHLVAHAKKPDQKHPEEKRWPGKYDIRGSAHIADLAHNVVCVWRNKDKEQKIAAAQYIRDAAEREEKLSELRRINDAIFCVQAQRGGDGEEPIKQLWFDPHGSWQYFDRAEWTADPIIGRGKQEVVEEWR